VSDIDTAAVDSLKVLDPKRPIREADIPRRNLNVRFGPKPDSCTQLFLLPLHQQYMSSSDIFITVLVYPCTRLNLLLQIRRASGSSLAYYYRRRVARFIIQFEE
jgi:hypothetical protein